MDKEVLTDLLKVGDDDPTAHHLIIQLYFANPGSIPKWEPNALPINTIAPSGMNVE